VKPHAEAAQVALPWAGTAQVVPHAPQLLRSDVVSAQAAPHIVKPDAQVKPQTPEVQVADPWEGGAHASVQVPQCAGDVARFTQAAPHGVSPEGHDDPQPFGPQT
jgi:hypothetical protein